MGSSILPVVADVRNEEQVNTCVRRAIEVYGAVDILVNNAGISMPRSVIDTDLGTWSPLRSLLCIQIRRDGIHLLPR